jgi:hypothetical protein
MRLPPDPAVGTALIATIVDLVRSASEAVARAQRVCELSRELVAAGRRAEADRWHGGPEQRPEAVFGVVQAFGNEPQGADGLADGA